MGLRRTSNSWTSKPQVNIKLSSVKLMGTKPIKFHVCLLCDLCVWLRAENTYTYKSRNFYSNSISYLRRSTSGERGTSCTTFQSRIFTLYVVLLSNTHVNCLIFNFTSTVPAKVHSSAVFSPHLIQFYQPQHFT